MISTTQTAPLETAQEAETWRLRIHELMTLCYQSGASDAEVELHLTTGFSVRVRQGQVDTVEQQNDRQLDLTVYREQRKATVSTTDLTQGGLEQLAQSACDIVHYCESDPYAGLAEPGHMANIDSESDLGLFNQWSLSIDQAIDQALSLEQQAVAYDHRLSGEETSVSTSQEYYVYANSRGFYGVRPNTIHEIGCVLIARDDQGHKERDEAHTVSRHPDQLLPLETIAQLAAQRTISRLNSQSVTTVKASVLFLPRVAQSIIGSFVSAISGGRLYRDASFLKDHLDQKVFPESVTIKEEPHLYGGLGSSYFDGDGMATYDKTFVDQGFLRNYCLSVYSARRLGMTTTANAGGIHNLKVEHAQAPNYAELVKQMGQGLIVTEVMGHGINLVTGDYSQGASGFWVDNGKIQYPVSELTIAGNLKTMFQNIEAIGSDVDTQSNIQTGSILVGSMTIAGH